MGTKVFLVVLLWKAMVLRGMVHGLQCNASDLRIPWADKQAGPQLCLVAHSSSELAEIRALVWEILQSPSQSWEMF